jgi:hypothetical protein
MITTVKGHTIDMNQIIEWVLFNRLRILVRPVDFLAMTDLIIQLPNFLFSTTVFFQLFLDSELWIKMLLPSLLYFIGQMIVNLRFGIGIIKILKDPLVFFSTGSNILMLALFITCFFFYGFWALLFIPIYLLAVVISVYILNSNEKKYYHEKWKVRTGLYDIFKNNAFIYVYVYYASKYHLNSDIEPTEDEINNMVWMDAYQYMRKNWVEMEVDFPEESRRCWRQYLAMEEEK